MVERFVGLVRGFKGSEKVNGWVEGECPGRIGWRVWILVWIWVFLSMGWEENVAW